MKKQLSEIQAAWLLSAVIIARSTSFIFSKVLLLSLPLFNLLAMRFMLAFIILAVICRKKLTAVTMTALRQGMVIGLCFTGVLICEMMCLKSCSTSTTSFLENSAIVIVPLLNMLITRRMPDKKVIAGSVCALTGVALLTVCTALQSFHFGFLYGLAAALLYSIAIILTGKFSKNGDSLIIGIIEVGTIGMCSLVIAVLSGNFTLYTEPVHYLYLLFLAVVCSGFGFTLQPMCQKSVSIDTAGILCALNPLSGTLLGIIFLHETVSLLSLSGCALILAGIIIPYIPYHAFIDSFKTAGSAAIPQIPDPHSDT